MINQQLLSPKSIVVVGASNNIEKPGGKIVKNLLDNNFEGELFTINPKAENIRGVPCFHSIDEVPKVDLAIFSIPARFCPDTMRQLAEKKGTRAFIIISAGFSEESEEGKKLEEDLVAIANETGSSLIGPNCIGVLTPQHASVFTTPIPELNAKGCDFVSGSGATAVFIMESGIPKGLSFSSVFSVGNSAQIGVEEVLQHWDENFNPETSSLVKLLYVESIANPDKFLRHSASLIRKGCRIAAVKAGSSSAGSRAASSHTGALANSDSAVEALFRKAGIVRCYGREELTTVASVFMCKQLQGKRIAIITHAGGPAVMLTDALEQGGLEIPAIADSPKKTALLNKLFPGSSVANPIDFLATGTAEHLCEIIDACENDFDEIDAMAVIFGSPGLFAVKDVYQVLNDKMKSCKKPIYPILPSVINVKDDVAYFLSHGNVNFPDEVLLGKALTKIYHTPKPSDESIFLDQVDVSRIRRIVDSCDDGYIAPEKIHELLDAAGIPRVQERTVDNGADAIKVARELGYPLVMKIVGPVHKSDVGGVVLNVNSKEEVAREFDRLIQIPETHAVLLAQQADGIELFLGATYEETFGHVVLCGMGGILVEVLKDVTSGLAPLTMNEAHSMIENLRSYKILKGYRGNPGINKNVYAEIIVRLSSMLRFTTEIKEIDLNPLLGKGDRIVAVDARIRIEK